MYGARVLFDGVARARVALSQGDVLAAYDDAMVALEADPDDLDAHFVAALALARSGAVERARSAADELVQCVDAAIDASPALREDAAALVARLAKDEALATRGTARRQRLGAAADLYERVADRYGRYYSCINAATLRLLAGDVARAKRLAARARDAVAADRDESEHDDYWREATDAEAALILGDVDGARRALAVAARMVGGDDAARAVTRRQLRLVCEATGAPVDVLDPLAAPLVLYYSGHLIDPSRPIERFPAAMEPTIGQQIRAYIANRRIGVAYGSLASGADILTAEALTAVDVPFHVVLPFDVDQFEEVSVAPAGPGWSERFHACLAKAASVTQASDSLMDDDDLFGYAARIAMGHALNHAAFLDAPAEQLAIWDGRPGSGVAGTAHDVGIWNAAGRNTHVISLPAASGDEPSDEAAPRMSTRRIGAILFTDLRGYSRLRDEQISTYVRDVFTQLAAVVAASGERLLWSNTWGDAIAAVFSDVVAAAECALGLHEKLAAIDLARLGLPADLDLRIGAHAGPVMAIADPVTGHGAYWGRELTRAARIEPRTPEGQVYVTDAFAALLALEPSAPFATEYVGKITTAKDFETIRMYRLYRRENAERVVAGLTSLCTPAAKQHSS